MWDEGIRIYGTPGVPNNFSSVRWKASQKKCWYAWGHGGNSGMHPEVPFSQVMQHGVSESVKPVNNKEIYLHCL